MLKKINIKSIIELVKKDFKLKLISLSVGIVMWFLVIGGVNPVVTRQFTDVPVSFKNQSVLESRKLIRVSPENPTVTVTITGKRSDVYSVNKSDIVAEVNLQNGITSGAHRLSINYKVPYNVQFKSASDNDLLVTLDEEISKTYKVEVETIGQIKNKNQVVAKKEPADSEVVVKGPVSYVNKVKRVRCVVDVTNKDGDEVVQSKIVPVDELNKEVKKVSLSKTDTNVSIGFKNFKEVPIKLVEINSPPSDVRILKKDIVPNIISIVGNLTSLEQISQINTKPFDLSQIKESGSYNLNLELPSDVTLVNNDLKVVINIDVDKKIEKPIKIAMVSDLHLGTFFGNGQLEKLNKIISEQKPDAVVIAGDLMDDDMVMYKKRNMKETLSKLNAPLGVYTTMGNHDRDAQEIVDEVKKAGIIPLFDESMELNKDVTLIGRKDRSVSRDRLDTADLLKSVNLNQTIVLIDHQPDAIDYHSTLPIDVQLSGHTHHGQMWPINYITERIYTLDYGYKEINGRHFFTSAGYGFWGPPFKTTARSEVWIITIEGK